MLRDFQQRFASGLLEREQGVAASEALPLDARRYGVYAHNTRVSLAVALENAFPVTKRLVGAEFFAAMAGHFVAAHPPTHGWLSAYGDGFPAFIAEYRPAAELVYLPDLARIEWARVHAANAPNDPSLDLKALATLNPETLENLSLSLHGAASLIGSAFPVFDIWQAHQHSSDDEMGPIDLAKGAQAVLISRTAALEVGVALLGPGDTALLRAIAEHLTFGAACQAALSAEADYDLGSRLGDWVCLRALSAVTGE